MTHKVIYILPNGREVREDENGYHVQPPHDNCWINGATVEEALTEAGWLKVPEPQREDENDICECGRALRDCAKYEDEEAACADR